MTAEKCADTITLQEALAPDDKGHFVGRNDEEDPGSVASDTSTRSWIDAPEAEKVWSFKATIAFWAAVYFVNGSVLFVVGSIAIYPGVCPDEAYSRAWVEYPFMVGAWCFTIANYLVYFQVINRLTSHGASGNDPMHHALQLRWILPRREHTSLGYYACLCNLAGAVFYNVNTMGMFGHYETSMSGYNWGYVMTGSVGSLWFALGGILEGEYNSWRKVSRTTLNDWPVLLAYFSFFGGVLFFVGYITDLNKFTSGATPQLAKFRTATFVATPFLLGSVFFLAGSWMMQLMWKKHMFGLGFAKQLTQSGGQRSVSRSQQLMMSFYCLNLCINLLTLGKLLGGDGEHWYTDVGSRLWLTFNVLVRIAGYNCIIGLASVVHVAPMEHPYPCLFWTMRLCSIFDFCGQIVWLVHENPLLFSS